MDDVYIEISLRLIAALAIGGAVGIERSYHGRPAGFRTHALVCLSTSLLMLVTVYQVRWFPEMSQGRVVIDPTRMAQGIMTGIGFLGAGAIMKEGLSVRGLTTAASIWITAAIGVLIGIGFYFPALLATLLTLSILSVFQWIEAKMPQEFYAHFSVRFAHNAVMSENELRQLVAAHKFSVANISYRFDNEEKFFEYRMVIRSKAADSTRKLSESLRILESVAEFRIAPTGD